jgi:hypothetical protein
MTLTDLRRFDIPRPRPDVDLTVTAVAARDDDDVEQLVRVAGFEPVDYVTAAEARQLARALIAAAEALEG